MKNAEYRAKNKDTDVFRLRNVLCDMKRRCYNSDYIKYKNWGGRGITVCDEWMTGKSSPFIEWALANGYKQGLQIDRIDNDGNYTPDNCRFVTAKVNANNKRQRPAGPYGRYISYHKQSGNYLVKLQKSSKCSTTICKYLKTYEAAVVYRDNILKNSFQEVIL